MHDHDTRSSAKPASRAAAETSPSTAGRGAKKNQAAAAVDHHGLPGALKSGIESLSGMSLDGVKVHRNSSAPAKLNAHAYAQGTDIHLAPGQEKHLPHEAWHVVQQAQGRVRPTREVRGAAINDDKRLEREADVMGEKALRTRPTADVGAAPAAQLKQFAAPLQLRNKGEAVTAETPIAFSPTCTNHGHTLPEILAQIIAEWGNKVENKALESFSVRWGVGAPVGIIFKDLGDQLLVMHAQSGANKAAEQKKKAATHADVTKIDSWRKPPPGGGSGKTGGGGGAGIGGELKKVIK